MIDKLVNRQCGRSSIDAAYNIAFKLMVLTLKIGMEFGSFLAQECGIICSMVYPL